MQYNKTEHCGAARKAGSIAPAAHQILAVLAEHLGPRARTHQAHPTLPAAPRSAPMPLAVSLPLSLHVHLLGDKVDRVGSSLLRAPGGSGMGRQGIQAGDVPRLQAQSTTQPDKLQARFRQFRTGVDNHGASGRQQSYGASLGKERARQRLGPHRDPGFVVVVVGARGIQLSRRILSARKTASANRFSR